ncbi:MAG: hypothetical protein MSA09_05415, partial [Lachnospiraceae bacterium]|nr:hypothetical protein [Lachnospiraceae bacterium]MDD7178565.1 hypothetical protein [bacterium]MDY5516260.1 hypothetical protein [Lachnospiraceae bacterium]
MIYQSQKMRLKCIRVIERTKINDIVICQDLNHSEEGLYTALVVHDHEVVKKFLAVYEQSEYVKDASCVESFSDQGAFVIVYPYQKERLLQDFYMGDSYKLSECEEICINTILACIASEIPYPILYLILEQRQLHLAKNHNVYLGYTIRLEELDPKKTERDCAVQCAKILRELLEPKASQKAISYQLLDKKISKKSYHRFTELYKDIRIAAAPKKRRGLLAELRAWFARNRDSIFHVLFWVCILLLLFVIATFVTQVIFGDIPWLRLLVNGFKKIGTESLLQ